MTKHDYIAQRFEQNPPKALPQEQQEHLFRLFAKLDREGKLDDFAERVRDLWLKHGYLSKAQIKIVEMKAGIFRNHKQKKKKKKNPKNSPEAKKARRDYWLRPS